MVERKISTEKYFIAGIITFLVFSLGFALGIILDNVRLRWAERINKEKEIDYASLQLQYLYLSTLKETNESCFVLHTALEKAISELGESLEKFQLYMKESKLNKEEYSIIGRKYLLDNLKYWLFARKSKQECDMDIVNILYFYSQEHCDICPNQGVILTYFKKKFGEKLLVFPIDVDFEGIEPMITLLRSRYNVTSYPTIIVEDVKYEGIVPKEKLDKIICNLFKDKSLC